MRKPILAATLLLVTIGAHAQTITDAQSADLKQQILKEVDSNAKLVQVMIDTILLGRNSTEISLTTTAPYVDRSDVSAAELRLADILLSRVRAAAAPVPFTA